MVSLWPAVTGRADDELRMGTEADCLLVAGGQIGTRDGMGRRASVLHQSTNFQFHWKGKLISIQFDLGSLRVRLLLLSL